MNNTSIPTFNIEEFEEKIPLLPDEVKRFLYKGGFKSAIGTLSKTFSLTNEQIKTLENALFVVIVGVQQKESLIQTCKLFGFSENQKKEFVSLCEKEIFEPLFELTNYEIVDGTLEIQAPTPLEALASIKDRLSQNAVVTPIARDYSLEKSQAPDNTPRSTIDPYRELPQ